MQPQPYWMFLPDPSITRELQSEKLSPSWGLVKRMEILKPDLLSKFEILIEKRKREKPFPSPSHHHELFSFQFTAVCWGPLLDLEVY